ncbi:cysteine--tRNA ligase [Candidatus Saccharibacteria bacterium]|nr:MAG: cysteine--tRNA ligase [Candidatus Saccharibacteria bacterium]
MTKLYNTMSRQVETLRPLDDTRVSLYTCGLTVYSQPHIGNWLGYIYWDVLVRVLRAEGYTVERTQNITDVGHLVSDDDAGEDKMEKSARAEKMSAWDVAKKYSDIAAREAYELLDLIRPDHLVAATSCIDAQIAFARALDEKGYLYRTADGMYFDTSKLDDYGKLAHLDVAGLEAGARVDMADKRNLTDFAVWKFSPANAQRDMEWDSPWGRGFPGWHLECSVIARETLGDTIDIHTGGIDHIPVHHTNEIAQTESLTGQPFANVWLHNNHIKVDGYKMSKSRGNIYSLADITERGFSLDAFKLLALSKHYRTEGNFTWDIMQAAQNRLLHWRSIAALRHQTHDTLHSDRKKSTDQHSVSLLATRHALLDALSHDLDTPKALAIIDEAFDRVEHVRPSRVHQQSLVSLLESIDQLLGLHLLDTTPDLSDEQKQRLLERQRAREAKDWPASDAIRDEFAIAGIALRDDTHGQIWSYLA